MKQIACPNCGKIVLIGFTIPGQPQPMYDAYRCGHCFAEFNCADQQQGACA